MQLEPVLKTGITAEQASRMLEAIDELQPTLELKTAEWLLIGPLIDTMRVACHRRIRGDA